jgi:hypothetical protein
VRDSAPPPTIDRIASLIVGAIIFGVAGALLGIVWSAATVGFSSSVVAVVAAILALAGAFLYLPAATARTQAHRAAMSTAPTTMFLPIVVILLALGFLVWLVRAVV